MVDDIEAFDHRPDTVFVWENLAQAQSDPLDSRHQRLVVIGLEIPHERDLFLRHHQHLPRLNGVDVEKSISVLVLINFVRGDLAVDNTRKEGRGLHVLIIQKMIKTPLIESAILHMASSIRDNTEEVRMMLPTMDYQQFVDLGIVGIIIVILMIIGYIAIWAIYQGKIKLVVFTYGDRGFLEIFGYPTPILIKGGTWLYMEGLITQSKTSVRKQTVRVARRDKVGNDIVLEVIVIVFHVIDTKEKIWAAIYEFMDPVNSGGLSDGTSLEFRNYIEMRASSAAMVLVEEGTIDTRECLAEHFETLCGTALDKVVGVKIDEARLIENAPPNEYSTAAGALKDTFGQFVGIPPDEDGSAK